MTVKFSKTATPLQYFSAPDNASYSFPGPPTEYTVAFILTLNGDTTSAAPQYIVSTGALSEAGSFHIVYNPTGVSTNAGNGRVVVYRNTATTQSLVAAAPNLNAGDTYLFAVVQNASGLFLYRCPILASAPTDGSAVITDATNSNSNGVALDGPRSLLIGARSDATVSSTRMLDNSVGRVFYLGSALSTFEIAQLAYGKEITDLGKTPIWYARLSTVNDFSTPFVKNGDPVTSTIQPAFGFSSAPGATAPIIDGAPTVSGSPVAGSTLTANPAGVGGSPSTQTLQWLEGTTGVQTGSTFALTATNAGKTYFLRQIQSNTAGTVSSDSAPFTVAAAPAAGAGTLTATPITARRFFQRSAIDPSATAQVPRSGTYDTSTTPTELRYQLWNAAGTTILQPWTTVTGATFNTTNKTWTGAPVVPQGGLYRMELQLRANGTVLATSAAVEPELFAVGALKAWLGSSSADYRFSSQSGTTYTANPNTGRYTKNGGWAAPGTDGASILEGNSFNEQSGVPVAMINCGAAGSTLLTGWLNTAGSQWTTFLSNLAAVGGKLESALITVGSNDASNGTVVSAVDHANNLKTLIQRVRDAVGNPNLPILLSGMNRRFLGSSSGFAVTDEQANFVHLGEKLVAADDPNVSLVQTLDFLVLASDGTHLTAGTGYPSSCARNAYVFGRRLYGDGVNAKGPEINAAGLTFTGDTLSVPVTFQHGTANTLTPSSDFTGFTVVDGTGTPNVVSRTLVGGRPTIKFDRQLVSPVTVGYLNVANPSITGQIYDNGTTPLPMMMASGLVATPTESAPVTGTFTTAVLTSSGTIRSGQACSYEWHSRGVIGTTTGAITYGSKALSAQGKLTVSELPLGAGYMLMKFPDDGVAYQEGSVV